MYRTCKIIVFNIIFNIDDSIRRISEGTTNSCIQLNPKGFKIFRQPVVQYYYVNIADLFIIFEGKILIQTVEVFIFSSFNIYGTNTYIVSCKYCNRCKDMIIDNAAECKKLQKL